MKELPAENYDDGYYHIGKDIEAYPDADLVLWTSDIASLHITDLNQDHEFKRKLKKIGLI